MKLKYTSVSIVVVLLFNMTGCIPMQGLPTSTVTVALTSTPTSMLTKTPKPTATVTSTPEPSPTATVIVLPTSLVNDPSALIITDECRAVVDGIYNLQEGLEFPEHLLDENLIKQSSDFDPNQYFSVLRHLSMESGYKLDFLYFGDELGGLPLVYARTSGSAPFESYEEFLGSYGEEISGERSYGWLNHSYDFLEKVRIDQSPESYFEFVSLALLGDQFYLFWHGLYNDIRILCEPVDLEGVVADVDELLSVPLGEPFEFSQEVQDKINMIDFTPVVLVGEDTISIRFVTFTKWGGFVEYIYVMDKDDPVELLDVQFNSLVEWDCGVNF